MSWRRFEALFSGLSPDGAVARALIRAGDPSSMAHHTDPIGQRAASREFLQWLRVKGIRKDDQICSSGN